MVRTAEAGLLNTKFASGHWAYRELFQSQYPKVKLRLDRILCFADDQERIVTAGGATAWQELALHVISRYCGAKEARETAKVHLLSDHTDGQLPFAVITHRVQGNDAVIADCQRWIAENQISGGRLHG